MTKAVDPATITVIIPVYGDEAPLRQLLTMLCAMSVDEIIVAKAQAPDAASTAVPTAQAPLCQHPPHIDGPTLRWLQSQKGRGIQIAHAAAAATSDIIWIVHADSTVPNDAPQHIRRLMADPMIAMGCFRLNFDHPHRILRLYSFFSRFDSILTTFGDQGFFVRRDVFAQVGYCPRWPLFEDVAMRQSLRRLGRVEKAPIALQTSARRFLAVGPIRTQIVNLALIIAYWLGVTPARLATLYDRFGKGRPQHLEAAETTKTKPRLAPQR
ncbi:MAG: glycosyltransferase [Pseudomonadota bacterium]